MAKIKKTDDIPKDEFMLEKTKNAQKWWKFQNILKKSEKAINTKMIKIQKIWKMSRKVKIMEYAKILLKKIKLIALSSALHITLWVFWRVFYWAKHF
jgi:hypothetical protein